MQLEIPRLLEKSTIAVQTYHLQGPSWQMKNRGKKHCKWQPDDTCYNPQKRPFLKNKQRQH